MDILPGTGSSCTSGTVAAGSRPIPDKAVGGNKQHATREWHYGVIKSLLFTTPRLLEYTVIVVSPISEHLFLFYSF